MDHSDKIKPLSEKIAASLLKGDTPIDLETFNTLTEDDKKHILFDIADKSKRRERLQLISKLNKKKAWKTVIGSEKQNTARRKMTFWYSAIAASIVISLSMTFLLNKDDGLQNNTTSIVESHIEIGTDKATLTLEDGSKVVLEKGTAYQTDHVTSNGEEIIYLPAGQAGTTNQQPTTKNQPPIAYNTLTIPRGAQFQIKLSDGTKIWLNSESQLKYPVAFNGGETRQVELVYGEAYFDVSPSTDHDGAKFKVLNQSQEVEVLGTEFNIKAYKDETNIYTTLVEGKVAVSYSNKNQILAPNQQSDLNTQNSSITISTVDTYKEVSWKEGIFSFREKSLKDIMKVLSRWYDMDVIFVNKDLENEEFIGSFNKTLLIEEILSSIKNTNYINDYEINDKTLVIK